MKWFHTSHPLKLHPHRTGFNPVNSHADPLVKSFIDGYPTKSLIWYTWLVFQGATFPLAQQMPTDSKCEMNWMSQAPPLSVDKFGGYATVAAPQLPQINFFLPKFELYRPKAFVISFGFSSCNTLLSFSLIPNVYHGWHAEIRSNCDTMIQPKFRFLPYGFLWTLLDVTPHLPYYLLLLSPMVMRLSKR